MRFLILGALLLAQVMSPALPINRLKPVPAAPAPATCPCFDQSSIQTVADTCSAILSPSCGTPGHLGLFCDASPGPVANLGGWTAVTGSGICSHDYWDIMSGEPIHDESAASPAQIVACQSAIGHWCP
jgi:hypothetical protein